MKFYTSVGRYGNTLMYRGYDGAERIKKRVPFKPTIFVNGDSEWKTLDGKSVAPIVCDSMRDATDTMKKYEGVDGMSVYGMNNYINQFITEVFPNDIKYDPNQIVVTTIDIEVASDAGFPEPATADYPVISICTKSSKEDFFRVWGLGDYTHDDKTIYNKCDTELQLINEFLNYWQNHGVT